MITVTQAIVAIAVVPITNLRIRSPMPASVTSSGLRL